MAKERQQKLQTAEECHCFYQDLTDALTFIQVLYPPLDHPSIHADIQYIYRLFISIGAKEEHS